MSEFRANLSSVMKHSVVRDRENVIIESAGVPVGVVITMDDYEDYLDLRDPVVLSAVAKGLEDYRAGKATRTRDLLAEIATPKPAARPRRR